MQCVAEHSATIAQRTGAGLEVRSWLRPTELGYLILKDRYPLSLSLNYRLKLDNAFGLKLHRLVQLQYQAYQFFSCQLIKSAHTDLLHTDPHNSCINPVNSLESFVTTSATAKIPAELNSYK